MSTSDQAAGGRGDAPRWRRPRIRLQRPTGIRNGGLLLLLVALAGVMALVDQPPAPVRGRGLPGGIQHLPPLVGITQPPPTVAQPPPVAGPPATPPVGAMRLESAVRAHPRRQHPRPASGRASSRLRVDAASRPGGGGGSGGSTSAVPPRVTSPPLAGAPPLRVRVPSTAVRVTPPRVLGRDLPSVQVEMPAVTVGPAASVLRRPPPGLTGAS